MFAKFAMAVVCAMGAVGLAAQDLTFKISMDKPDGFYSKNEEVIFSIQALEKDKPVVGKKFQYEIFWNGESITKLVTDSKEEPTVARAKGGQGWVWLVVSNLDKGKPTTKNRAQVGAMFDAQEIQPGAAEPEDFGKFWQGQRTLLDTVPARATVTPVDGIDHKQFGKFECYDIKVDCASVTPVSGYLTVPAGARDRSLKAMVRFQGAGVYSANKVCFPNTITLEINAHGIINGQSREFYDYLNKNDLFDYRFRHSIDRDRFYFREMFLRVMRSLDYIKTRPEWNGKDLIVYGSSQGGAQALVAAAMDAQVTLCVACVPALSDHGGILAGRLSGWPRLISLGGDGKPSIPQVAETSGYFDCVNFAKRIKAETVISVGFVDSTCSPTSVYAVYNSLPEGTKKAMYSEPGMGHEGRNPLGDARIKEIISQ